MLPLALPGAGPVDGCAALTRLALPTLEIASAAREGDVCRVEAVARPRPNAAIGLSLWLPPPARWSGRYYQMGNGGFAGSIDRATLAAAAARGDAAAATDTGHRGTGFDAGWARGRPDLVEDYAWRSIKVTADAARALTTAYYGRAAERRYFMGCSFGGRQALVAAARWPADWDGIVTGAPAVDWTGSLTGLAAIQHRLRSTPDGWIAPDRIGALIAGARATPAEARSLATLARAGYPLAGADPAEWRRWIVNPDPAAPGQARLATEAFRYVFGDAPGWNVGDFRAGHGVPARIGETFAVGSLAPFLRRGGKVIAYVGTADAVLPPAAVARDLRRRFAGPLRQRTRLLIVPGMAHCQGSDGPHAFGQSLTAPSLRSDPDHDVRRALESWVETGRSPRIMTVATVGATIRRTRTLRYRD